MPMCTAAAAASAATRCSSASSRLASRAARCRRSRVWARTIPRLWTWRRASRTCGSRGPELALGFEVGVTDQFVFIEAFERLTLGDRQPPLAHGALTVPRQRGCQLGHVVLHVLAHA